MTIWEGLKSSISLVIKMFKQLNRTLCQCCNNFRAVFRINVVHVLLHLLPGPDYMAALFFITYV